MEIHLLSLWMYGKFMEIGFWFIEFTKIYCPEQQHAARNRKLHFYGPEIQKLLEPLYLPIYAKFYKIICIIFVPFNVTVLLYIYGTVII